MDGLIEHFSQHHDHFLYVMAGIFLLVELSVLGMSGPLLFVSLGSLLTGILVTTDFIHGWDLEFLSVGIFSVMSAVLLWKPLKKFQNAGGGPDTSSDMIGKDLLVTFPVTHDEGRVSYSGIEWQARLDVSHVTAIPVASRALVVGVDGSLLIVMPH